MDQLQEQDQNQDQNQDQLQDQAQEQTVEVSHSVPENQNIKIDHDRTPDQFLNTPGSTSDCQKILGGQIGWTGLGLGLNIPISDKDCRKLRVFSYLVEQNKHKAAAVVICDTKFMKEAFDKDEVQCRQLVGGPPEGGGDRYTADECDEREGRRDRTCSGK